MTIPLKHDFKDNFVLKKSLKEVAFIMIELFVRKVIEKNVFKTTPF